MQFKIIQLTKQQFNKFHKIRTKQSHLYGQHHLYLKNHQKYISKQLPITIKINTTRVYHPLSNFLIYSYQSQNSNYIIYLFPLIGQPLTISSFYKYKSNPKIQDWIQRSQGLQNALWQVIQTALKATQLYKVKDIILQCLRIHNGIVYYIYDSWINDSRDIVKANPQQLENYYFSEADLREIQQKRQMQGYTSRKNSTVFRIALMTLNLGTSELKLRNYQFAGLFIQWKNIEERLKLFKSKYNDHGLGDFLQKILIKGQNLTMQDLWTLIGQSDKQQNNKLLKNQKQNTNLYIPLSSNLQSRKKPILTLKSNNHLSSKNRNLDITISQVNNLNNLNLNFNNNNNLNASFSILSDIQNNLNNNAYNSNENNHHNSSNLNHSFSSTALNDSLLIATTINKSKRKIKAIQRNISNKNRSKSQQKHFNTSCFSYNNNKYKESKQNLKQYQLSQPFSIKNMLIQANQFYTTKLTSFLGLDQHLPSSQYQKQILNSIENVDIKSNWIKKLYPNGSLYFGQINNQTQQRQGKGLYIFQSDDFYYGDWKNNKIYGVGCYIFKTGQSYRGSFQNGKKTGHGVFKYLDGRVFQGSWSNNCKFGLGTINFPNNITFMGIFGSKNNITDGLFINNLTGKQWSGILQQFQWSQFDNQKNRQQIQKQRKEKLKHCRLQRFYSYSTKQGEQYQGQCVEGKKQGFGIMKKYTKLEKQKQTDELVQQVFEGYWYDDLQNGDGKLTISNNFCIEGKWKDGIFIQYKPQI